MKKLTILIILSITAIIAAAKNNLTTVVYDNNTNLPLVGGIITNYNDNVIVKLLIVSTYENNLTLNSETQFSNPYSYEGKEINQPLTYRVIDCSNVNKEQFFCYLMALMPNTTYYVKSCVVYSDGNIQYGNTIKLKTPNNYTRSLDKLDVANVWNGKSYNYTTFDLVTDEIINVEKGFIFTTNENPLPYKTTKKIFNTCYKFNSIWNYITWISHNKNIVEKSNIVKEPVILQNNSTITIISDNSTYYEINPNQQTKPQDFSKQYTKPFNSKKGDIIKAYSVNKNTKLVSYVNIFITQ